MKTRFNPRTITRSVMSLFVPSKTVNAHKLYGDAYYRNIYFTKQTFDGIKQIADLTRKSKKETANALMLMGISRFWGEVLGKYNEEVLAERELAKNPEIVRFIRAYNKMAKEKGFDISKIYNTKTDNKKNS